MTENTPAAVGDDELHAFVDGQLDQARLAPLLEWLRTRPDAALRVAQWHAQRLQLRQLHRGIDPGPTPPALAAVVMRGRRRLLHSGWGQAAAAVGLLVCGVAAGLWWSADGASPRPAAAPPFVRDAAVAHAVFSPEVRHPVEVPGAEEPHLVQWLSRRLGAPLRAPVLREHGFRLLGGRLLPGDPTPRAQYMYEDARGRRVTLYVTVFAPGAAPAETAFRSLRDGTRESFYWIEGRFGYALSADLPSAELQGLARDVYEQLGR